MQDGGRKARSSKEQKREAKLIVGRRDSSTETPVRGLVKKQYGVSYGKQRMLRTLRQP